MKDNSNTDETSSIPEDNNSKSAYKEEYKGDQDANKNVSDNSNSGCLLSSNELFENNEAEVKSATYEDSTSAVIVVKEQTEHDAVYDSLVFNSETIDVYQYSNCPKRYFSSLLKLLKEELPEPYCFFLLKHFFKCYGDIALIATIKNSDNECVGAIVNKVDYKTDTHGLSYPAGYICMLAVSSTFQGCGIGSYLLNESIKLMHRIYHITTVILDAETTNTKALRFYEKHGFTRTRRKPRYYTRGVDAFELIKYIS